MSREALEELMDRWMNDPAFRRELHSNPEETIEGTGLSLTPDEIESLMAMEGSLPGEELEPRISRS